MVDLQSELVGTVVAVTPAFCVFEVEGALCVSSWRDVAIGNVVPARETLPPDIHRPLLLSDSPDQKLTRSRSQLRVRMKSHLGVLLSEG